MAEKRKLSYKLSEEEIKELLQKFSIEEGWQKRATMSKGCSTIYLPEDYAYKNVVIIKLSTKKMKDDKK